MGLFELIITLYIGVMTYLANLADMQKMHITLGVDHTYNSDNLYSTIVRKMLFGLIIMIALYGLYADRILLLDLPAATLTELGISPEAMSITSLLIITAFTAIVCGISFFFVISIPMRQRIQSLFGKKASYNPQSDIHLVAMILALCLVGYLFINFVVAGGLNGVAKSIEENGISLNSLIFQGGMFVVIAFLGVGLAIRHNWAQVLKRLGLQKPTPQNIIVGVISGIVLIAISLLLTYIWMRLVTAEQYAQQSASAAEIDNQFNTIQAAFILATTSAISEEILFRGALQPVFGLPVTTLFFVLFHDQYTLTPAMFIILVIGLGLGWLRRYQSTTSTIVAHFIYNFLPIAVIITWPQLAQTLGLS